MRRWASILVLLLGCQKPATVEAGDVHFVQVFAQGADASSPLLVWLHGRGGRADRFERTWAKFPVKVEIELAQGFIPYGGGYAWFDWGPDTAPEDVTKNVLDAEEHVWRGITAVAHGRKVLVGGFSQGAMLTYVLAARHPEIGYAFPIAGMLAPGVLPDDHRPTAPIFAMHGVEDQVIEVALGRAAVAAFQEGGGKAELEEVPGVGHELTPAMVQELARHVEAALPALH